MGDYVNPDGKYPQALIVDVPGISLPDEFAIEAADRTLAGPGIGGDKPKAEPAPKTNRVRFPSRDATVYGEAIARLVGSFSGPGFNIIFRPHSDKKPDAKLKLKLPDDDLLELNLTHEIWKFPWTKSDLGEIPNRVSQKNDDEAKDREDVFLRGIPYTQIVRDVTDTEIDKGTRVPVDRLGRSIDEKKKSLVQDIHFEPGLFIHVPNSMPVSDKPTITRMASIPHGTTINAQGAAAIKKDGNAAPDIQTSATASKPFGVGNTGILSFFDDKQFDFSKDNATRLPQKMGPFKTANSITKEMVDDPNVLLKKHNEGKTFSQVIKFTVSTAPIQALEKQACPHLAARGAIDATNTALDNIDKLIASNPNDKITTELENARAAIAQALKNVNESTALPVSNDKTQILARTKAMAPAIGSANIAFLDGNLGEGANPNAKTGKVESTFWISTVVYTIEVKDKFVPGNDANGKPKLLQVDPVNKDKLAKDTVPSFVFPADKPVEAGRYSVEATQIQYSQTVNLVFNTLVWPHISVATVIPLFPVLVKTATKLK